MSDTTNSQNPDLHQLVRQRYAAIANRQSSPAEACGCSTSSACCQPDSSMTTTPVERIYEIENIHELPQEVTSLSLGCGDPITLASLKPGETVLDLGSGGGIDCFLAARAVGETGKVIGVDMTPAMLDRARASKARLGVANVEFRLGEIEHLPVPDGSVDVIISNCVINLSPNKPQVFHEAFRVLKSGGRLAVSDIVTDGEIPPSIRQNLDAWAGCIAGAMDVQEYLNAIRQAGFTSIQLTPTHITFSPAEIPLEHLNRMVFSARITARKP